MEQRTTEITRGERTGDGSTKGNKVVNSLGIGDPRPQEELHEKSG